MDKFQQSLKLMVCALAVCSAVAGGLAQGQAQAQTPEAHDAHEHAAPAGEAVWILGEVRRIDAEAGKLTLKHDAIPQFEMAAMTMAFRVARPTLLDGLAVGDKVRFRVDKRDQRFIVIDVQILP